jgi:hypothetical protein
MLPIKNPVPRSHKVAVGSLILICLVSLGCSLPLSEYRSKPETMESVWEPLGVG